MNTSLEKKKHNLFIILSGVFLTNAPRSVSPQTETTTEASEIGRIFYTASETRDIEYQ